MFNVIKFFGRREGDDMPRDYAASGRLGGIVGGRSQSEAKKAAARQNGKRGKRFGKLGGRPPLPVADLVAAAKRAKMAAYKRAQRKRDKQRLKENSKK